MNTGEPVATESGHDWFGGGPSEKDQVNWHLVGGLPYGTPGSASGLGKRAGSNPGTAPQADSTDEIAVDLLVTRSAISGASSSLTCGFAGRGDRICAFDRAAGGLRCSGQLALARIIEPVGTLDSLLMLEIGVSAPPYRTVLWRLPVYARASWRWQLAVILTGYQLAGSQ